MANPEHLAKVRLSREVWDRWREACPEILPDLENADLRDADLSYRDLSDVNLIKADLRGADLNHADLLPRKPQQSDVRFGRDRFSGSEV